MTARFQGQPWYYIIFDVLSKKKCDCKLLYSFLQFCTFWYKNTSITALQPASQDGPIEPIIVLKMLKFNR